jgi:hypothetical protein
MGRGSNQEQGKTVWTESDETHHLEEGKGRILRGGNPGGHQVSESPSH